MPPFLSPPELRPWPGSLGSSAARRFKRPSAHRRSTSVLCGRESESEIVEFRRVTRSKVSGTFFLDGRKSAGPEPPEPGKRGVMRGPRAVGFPPKSAPHR
jgi:hypothetical protein